MAASYGGLGSLFGSAQDNSCVFNGRPINCSDLAHQIDIGNVSALVNRGGGRTVEVPLMNFGLGVYQVWVANKDGPRSGPLPPDDDEVVRVGHEEDDRFGHYELFLLSVVPQQSASGLNPQGTKSGCRSFVDLLVDRTVDGGQMKDDAGRNLALWARGTLAPQAKAGKLPFDGFKANLIDGGQNGYAMVHIAGVAGVSLVGSHKSKVFYGPTGNEIRDQQFTEDRGQLERGLFLKKGGHKTLDGFVDGYAKDYPIDMYINEKRAEIADDEAGVAAAGILSSAYGGHTRRSDAKNQIFNLICDK